MTKIYIPFLSISPFLPDTFDSLLQACSNFKKGSQQCAQRWNFDRGFFDPTAETWIFHQTESGINAFLPQHTPNAYLTTTEFRDESAFKSSWTQHFSRFFRETGGWKDAQTTVTSAITDSENIGSSRHFEIQIDPLQEIPDYDDDASLNVSVLRPEDLPPSVLRPEDLPPMQEDPFHQDWPHWATTC